MSAGQKVITGLKVPEDEAASVAPSQIRRLLPEASPEGEVELQAFCTLVYCPYCGKAGRCAEDAVPGSYFRCLHCGALFRT